MGHFDIDAANHAEAAARRADSNLTGTIALIKMVSEMREWEKGRFNAIIDGMHKQTDELKVEINDLKAQVAGLQSRLYELEQKKSKGFSR